MIPALVVFVVFLFVEIIIIVVPILLVFILLVVEVEILFFIFVFFVFGWSEIELDRIERYDLQIDAAFRASDDFADVLKFFIYWCVTLRTITHDQPPTKAFR